jgi:hypothetical protein
VTRREAVIKNMLSKLLALIRCKPVTDQVRPSYDTGNPKEDLERLLSMYGLDCADTCNYEGQEHADALSQYLHTLEL